MKHLNVVIFFIFTFIVHPSYADEYAVIDYEIEEIRHQVKLHQSSIPDLLILNKKLSTFIPVLQQCIATENKKISALSAEYEYLKNLERSNYLLQQQEEYDTLMKRIGSHQDMCGFLLVKTDNIQKQIYYLNENNFNSTLFVQQPPFWRVVSNLRDFNYPHLRAGFIFDILGNETAFFRTSKVDLVFLLILMTLKMLSYSSFGFFRKFRSIRLYRFICILFVFTMTLPVPFILLKLVYRNSDLTLIDFFNHHLYIFISVSIIYYLYREYEIKHYAKETILFIVSILLYGLLLRLCFGITYFELQNLQFEKIILLKYLLLIDLQFVLTFLIYWLLHRILQCTISKKKYAFFLAGQCIIFIFGLSGFFDIVIEFELTFIIGLILSIWCMLLLRLVHIFISHSNNKALNLHILMDKHLAFFSKKAIISTHFLIKFIYYISIIQIIIVILSSVPFLLSNENLQYISDLLYNDISFNGMSVKIIDIYQATLIFPILNLFSYFFAVYLSKSWLKREDSIQKTANIIHWICLVFNFFICMIISGLQLSSFIILLGGLSFGIGLGLKNILSSIISGIILFVNRPFEIGDYIEINQTKGFVKNLTLFETLIETLDKNTLIFPNQLVSSSVIQNMTYANKSSQKIHISYIFAHLDLAQEELVKTSLLSLFKDNPDILIDQYNGIKFLFSPLTQTSDDTRLEIIFSVKTLKNLQENLSKLNRQTLIKLKALNLDVKFENMQQPF